MKKTRRTRNNGRYRIEVRCFNCGHSCVCGRQNRPPENCRDFVDRERFRELPPCGETVIYWIYDTEFDLCAPILDLEPSKIAPRIEESTVNVTAWGIDADGNLWGRYDDEWFQANHQWFYLSRGIAELALKTGSWRQDEEADL